MYIKVRKIGAQPNNDLTVVISKTSSIENLRQIIFEKWDIQSDQQMLLYKGKQLIDEHRVVDYNIQLNDVVQLMIKQSAPEVTKEEVKDDEIAPNSAESGPSDEPEELVPAESRYYKIGDLIDFVDCEYGSWNEAKIVSILRKSKHRVNDESSPEDGVVFRVITEYEDDNTPFEVNFDDIRPRSRYIFKKQELKEQDKVLANYNIESPKERGQWYDFKIEKISSKYVEGVVYVGKEKMPLANCRVKFIDEIMKIESPELICERSDDESSDTTVQRKVAPKCNKCKDNNRKNCNECGCRICSGKENIATIILCDDCDYGYHIACLTPPLLEIPEEEEWYCPSCKTDENEIVKAGDKLKFSNKKAKMASNQEKSANRDWGRGMATVGRTKECTIVPKSHFGPVPGVEVGTCWMFRVQVSEAGVHRPHVAGIHGRESDGAYSLVLSGGYEDDVDNGDEFYYTGSGGRDLSGNKRVSVQSKDQQLTSYNKALALNCNAKFNDKEGAVAKDWKAGKPVRVVRNYHLAQHSKFAPKVGNRYDGIYKVVKYYPEKGKSGFLVWKFMLRRDDPNPAPWAEGGQELEMIVQYPPGYLEAQAEKEREKASSGKNKTKGVKRPLQDSTNSPDTAKKSKQSYKLDSKLEELIKEDEQNSFLWTDCKSYVQNGKQAFLTKVQEIFLCICCQEVVHLPVSTPCKHNLCKSCLQRSFASQIFTCPCCRHEFGENYKLQVNEELAKILQFLFPGYESGR